MNYKLLVIGNRRLQFHYPSIGRGSFSKVYYAVDLESGIKYAIKRIHLTRFDQKDREAIEREVEIIKSLNHPNIVKYYGVNIIEEYMYIFLEWCNKGTLEEQYKQSIVKSNIQFFFLKIRDAFQYLRTNNIMHRDIKLSNILLHEENGKLDLKLSDFGFAKSYEQTDQSLEATLCGTPYYMAPEMLLGEKYNSKSDLWSVGIVLYLLIYQHMPFTPTNIIELIRELEKGIKYDPTVDISPRCLSLLKGLLTNNPDERISWDEFFSHPCFINHHELTPPQSDNNNNDDDDFECIEHDPNIDINQCENDGKSPSFTNRLISFLSSSYKLVLPWTNQS
ncbi:hypothetical protein BH23THE1_BH23THE1_26350 [soil metagenome]